MRLESLSEDPDAYRVLAQTVATQGVFGLSDGVSPATPTAFRPPLYPWLLSRLVNADGVLANGAVAGLHLLLGVLTVLMTWDIARRLIGVIGAVIAAGLVLLDPILLWQSTVVMTETLATTLATLAWWWWVVFLSQSECKTDACETDTCDIDICSSEPEALNQPARTSPARPIFQAVLLAVILGLCYLCRPPFLVWAVFLLPLLWWVGPICRIRRLAIVGVTTLVLLAFVAGWTLRNMQAIGHPVWATTHGGYTLLLANNESFYDYLRNGNGGQESTEPFPWTREPWDPSQFFKRYQQRHLGDVETASFWMESRATELTPSTHSQASEREDDQIAYRAAKATIQRQPGMFVYSCWVRLTRLWQPFPHATDGRSSAVVFAVGAFYCLIYASILIAIWKRRSWFAHASWWPAITLVIALSAVHSVYWSNPRMRAPVTPMLAIAATAAFVTPKRLNKSSTS